MLGNLKGKILGIDVFTCKYADAVLTVLSLDQIKVSAVICHIIIYAH